MTRSKATRVTTPPTTAQEHDPSALRHRLVDQLLAAGHVRTASVEAALRRVPRHAFAPEVPVKTAYADDIIPTCHTPDGRVSSSVSAPWLQAVMLESARLRSGHHVLEVGSGGYNAALIAELVGRTGQVTTVDIAPDVTDRAIRLLRATGYDRVRVLTADAEHLPPETIPEGGFDAVIVTVDTWDLPWITMVAEGGRLVAPLRLHQYVWSIGFTKHDGALISEEPLTVCGFVPMQGAGAWDPNLRTIPGHGIRLAFEDGTPLPVDQLAPAFDKAPTTVRTNVTVEGEVPFDSLTLYLAGALPGFCRLSVDPDHHTGLINPPPPHWPGAATVRGTSLARLAHERIGDGENDKGVYEFVIHGYGPAGHLAATEMAESVRQWQRNHRAAPCPHITVQPEKATRPTSADTDGLHVFHKKHTRIKIDWPIVPCEAAPAALANAQDQDPCCLARSQSGRVATAPATADYWEPLWAGGRRYREVTSTEAALLADHVGPGHGRPALDIGTGEGSHARRLHQPGYRTIGIDFAPSAIAAARNTQQSNGPAWHLTDFVSDDLSALPDATYAVVTCRLVYRWIDDKAAFLDRVRQVLAPDGTFWVVTEVAGRRKEDDPYRHLGITPAEAEILTAGWSVVRTVDIDVLRCYALHP
ncbi:methyltransferase, FxLD system [Streptomyces sp. NBC_00557]|uniref:methyltransferase, FxLD system n=1 Tax=Streptomyces sp. NBC_00557 TaxID=2975776 RepID=UPI002E800C16|nr:methyltransferase, FxLD system [Streptomyces sp. NBC_00557]WUC33344.1 methyltransferase, FxLD system [Streptomyces sp. NBC_00557]